MSILPTSRKRVLNPEKELRFTRSRQAMGFALLAAMCVGAAVTILTIVLYTASVNIESPINPLWSILPLTLAIPCGWAALYLASHAYILLTPLGIEIFPLWRPATNLRILYWAEIGNITIDDIHQLLVIDFKEGGGGVVLTLNPIRKSTRVLLRLAIEGRARTSPSSGEQGRTCPDENRIPDSPA